MAKSIKSLLLPGFVAFAFSTQAQHIHLLSGDDYEKYFETPTLRSLIKTDLFGMASGRFGIAYERSIRSNFSLEGSMGMRHHLYQLSMRWLDSDLLGTTNLPYEADVSGSFFEMSLIYRMADDDLGEYQGYGITLGRSFWPYSKQAPEIRSNSLSIGILGRSQKVFYEQFTFELTCGLAAHYVTDWNGHKGWGYIITFQVSVGYMF
jgi:hypothetical protein